ncbi:ABC transporter permease, partial [Pseudomonas sp. FSL R10-2189]|nr:ABC transporter permease [Pseudomonas sp. FSL R10-2189]
MIQAEPLFAAQSRSARRWAIRPGLLLAGLFVLLLLIAAIQPGWLVAGDPLDANSRLAFSAPSSLFWLGADENGRDILTRLVYA